MTGDKADNALESQSGDVSMKEAVISFNELKKHVKTPDMPLFQLKTYLFIKNCKFYCKI